MIITIVRSGTSDRTYINPSFASTAEMRGVKRDASTRNKIEKCVKNQSWKHFL